MVYEVEALLCKNPSGCFTRGRIPRRAPNPTDVEIAVHYTGICHTDVHTAKGEWPMELLYPMVPGHEIAGVVIKVGDKVTKFKAGDKVGVGTMVDSCRECRMCKQDGEQYCEKGMIEAYNTKLDDDYIKRNNMPDNKTYGGYSQQTVVDERFVCKIPDSIPMEYAGPLLCAGITTYSPLKYFGAMNAGSEWCVGIVGFGGLGDMAAKISKAMGNKVTVISTHEDKRQHAEKDLGVEFICSGKDKDSVKSMVEKHSGKFNFILSTISSKYDINAYLNLLAQDGTFCLVGSPPEPLDLIAQSLISGRKKLVGSLIGGMKETQEMLDFCGKNGICSSVELIPASGINRAFKEIADNTCHKARFVIKVKETLKSDDSWDVDQKSAADAPEHKVHPDANIIGAENVAGKTYDPRSGKFK